MSFYQCPLDLRISRLFGPSPEKLLRPRIPIAERAARAARARNISYAEALKQVGRHQFELAGNHFTLFDKLTDQHLTASLISQLGSILKDARVGIWIWLDHQEHPWIAIAATRYNIDFPKDPGQCAQRELLYIDFKLYHDERSLWICEVESQRRGLGGAALTALYNVAKDNSLRFIQFAAHDGNSNAQQFYFHLDFGKPREEGGARWEVNIDRAVCHE